MTDSWDDTEGADRAALATEPALELLIRELLLERTGKLDGATLAAFIDGWSSLLDLLGRVDLLLPGAPAPLREALTELIQAVRDAQERALADDDLA